MAEHSVDKYESNVEGKPSQSVSRNTSKKGLCLEQQIALESLEGPDNVFLTGEAGAGKSFLIRHFRKGLDPKEFPTLASTGAAAVLVGGRTFHSFFGLGIMEGGVASTVQRALKDKKLIRRIKKISGIIVDEVSMLSSEVLLAAYEICQIIRENKHPWGGLKVIMVGDFAQLPPVVKFGQRRQWAFESPVWRDSELTQIYLQENHRTSDPEFIRTLNTVRMGEVDQTTAEFLNERTVAEYDPDQAGTRLFPRVAYTEKYNNMKLERLPEEEIEFPSLYAGSSRFIEKLKKMSPLPETLILKLDAYVMLRVNDPKQRWVNGTTGYVRDIYDDELVIELDSGRVIQLEKMTFSLLDAEGHAQATVTNFPVTLAYAITIHKAQGLTLVNSFVDLKGLWEPGHAYVALSRCTSSEGLNILRWEPKSVIADPKVQSFYHQMSQN